MKKTNFAFFLAASISFFPVSYGQDRGSLTHPSDHSPYYGGKYEAKLSKCQFILNLLSQSDPLPEFKKVTCEFGPYGVSEQVDVTYVQEEGLSTEESCSPKIACIKNQKHKMCDGTIEHTEQNTILTTQTFSSETLYLHLTQDMTSQSYGKKGIPLIMCDVTTEEGEQGTLTLDALSSLQSPHTQEDPYIQRGTGEWSFHLDTHSQG